MTGEPAEHVVLVLGMHRSGTSAVAACLEQSGLVMGRTLACADEWNPGGYFEERKIVDFNNRLLEMSGCRWDSPLPPNPACCAQWAEQVEPAAKLLEATYGGAAAWGFKDPRMCVLAPFWRQVFASMRVSPRVLMVLRHPAEVADSLARRDGISSRRAGWLWLSHLIGSLDYIQDAPDFRLIDFSESVKAPARLSNELAEWLGVSSAVRDRLVHFSSRFISPRLTRGVDAGAIETHPLVLRAYEYWRTAASCGAFATATLHAAEWLDIRDAFERDVKPGLAMVQDFFEADRQLSVMESRSKDMARGLTTAEQLAMQRLEQIHVLGTQLKKTQEALDFAEKLALQRQDELQALNVQLRDVSTALSRAEQLVHTSRRDEIVAEQSRELDARDLRIRALEALALQRLADVEALDRELRITADALARAEQLAFERLAELEKAGQGCE